MNATANVVDSHHHIAMSSLQDSLAAASAMSPPFASAMSPHSLHRAQGSTRMAIPSSMSAAGTGTNQSSASHNRRPQRNVRFNDQISGVIVPSLDDMPIKERQNIWYSVSFQICLLSTKMDDLTRWHARMVKNHIHVAHISLQHMYIYYLT